MSFEDLSKTEFRKTSVTDLINLWIDISRPQTQWRSEGREGDWNASKSYNDCLEKLEATISKKLNVSVLEVRIILNCK